MERRRLRRELRYRHRHRHRHQRADPNTFFTSLQRVRENDPNTWKLRVYYPEMIQNLTPDEWEQIGQAIANNTHLTSIVLWKGALNEQKVLSLFQGLTRSNSITSVNLSISGLSVAGVRSMLPFLQNANNLVQLVLGGNNITSEGFNLLFRALRGSPIETLGCFNCGIESIEIDRNNMPQRLKFLHLHGNNINAGGCRGLATLLQGRDSTLENLYLNHNNIDDEGVAILVDVLQNNTSLNVLYLKNNEGISVEGVKLFLRLVNDISSINATLQSNHTLRYLYVQVEEVDHDVNGRIRQHIENALEVNRTYSYENDPEAAGREKVIQTQLRSVTRAELADLQGVNHSVYSEINPLHLPEVLALVGERHGHEELFVALRSSIGRIDFLA